MAVYLLDTNVSLRFLDSSDAAHQLTADAVAALISRGDEPVITGQVVVELWSVATRPQANNGFGWTLARVQSAVQGLRARFVLLEDNAQIFPQWLKLVAAGSVQGKQVHDARLAAVLLAHGHQHILTFNGVDFGRYPGIVAVHPRDLIGPSP